MSKYCMFCGEELPDAAQFCPSCGKKQNSETKQQIMSYDTSEDTDDEIDLLLKYGMMDSAPAKKEKPRVIKIDSPIDELIEAATEEPSEQSDTENIVVEPESNIITKTKEPLSPMDILSSYEEEVEDSIAEKNKSAVNENEQGKLQLGELDIPEQNDFIEPPQENVQNNALLETKTKEILPEESPFVSESKTPESRTTNRISRKAKDDFVITDDEDDEDDFGVIITEDDKEEPEKPSRRRAARRDVSIKKRSVSLDEEEDEFNTDINTASAGGINFDSEKIHADEITEREKRKNAIIEDDGDRSSLEGRTANTQKQTKRRQSQRNYNDKKIYEIEHDRSAIDENEDPNYDGYYENVLPVDYDRDVKKNIDWKTIGIVCAFVGFIALFIFVFATYLI